eukprot:356736-Chlamydomonas_euryale.AAC.2
MPLLRWRVQQQVLLRLWQRLLLPLLLLRRRRRAALLGAGIGRGVDMCAQRARAQQQQLAGQRVVAAAREQAGECACNLQVGPGRGQAAPREQRQEDGRHELAQHERACTQRMEGCVEGRGRGGEHSSRSRAGRGTRAASGRRMTRTGAARACLQRY